MSFESTPFRISSNDLEFLRQQVNVSSIKILRYDNSQPIYGYVDQDNVTHELGILGSFDPLNPALYVNTTSHLTNTTDPLGVRNVNGAFNNLTAGHYTWGGTHEPFIRFTTSDYSNYLQQNTTNAAYNPGRYGPNTPGFQDSFQTVANGMVVTNQLADSSALYANPFKTVVDYTPRMIAQTVSSQAALDRLNIATDIDRSLPNTTLSVVRNLATDASAPSFSGWFVLFGQFFDHGLDFIDKGGNRTNGRSAKIVMPLSPTDPLYDPARGITSMTISRATVSNAQNAGADGRFRTADDIRDPGVDKLFGTIDDVLGPVDPLYLNHTSPYIDASQVYGSDDQITALLRRWVADPNQAGRFIAGAELFSGTTLAQPWDRVNPDGTTTLSRQTMPTLKELRAHLLETGRDDLSWDDILNYRARDAQGRVLDTNSAMAGVQSMATDQALLLDLNPHFDAARIYLDGVNPDTTGPLAGFVLGAPNATSMGFPANIANYVNLTTFTAKAGLSAADQAIANELLLRSVGDHYLAGDGRVNENFGLTTVHHVFHENHNWQLEKIKQGIAEEQNADSTRTYAHSWQLAIAVRSGASLASTVRIVNGHYEDAQGNYVTATGEISWNQEKLFQAAVIVNQMAYQHVAVDQYARYITPDIPEPAAYDPTINANISLEYAQAAFRFGHSQLRETLDFLDPKGSLTAAVQHFALEKAFLNPAKFAEIGPAAVALGMTRQVGAETDEFITPALQQTLVGQALDLSAINIARGRDLGLPTLNAARRQMRDALLAEQTAGVKIYGNLDPAALMPYVSWQDFADHMIHPASLVNFIAAYVFDGNLAPAEAIVGLKNGTIQAGTAAAQGYTVAQANAFLNGGNQDFNKIDLWLGGLAEKHVTNGQLGSTFNAVFADQITRLINGDRFYYIARMSLGAPLADRLKTQIETENFKDIIERTTGARHLNGDVMTYADSYVELGETPSGTGLGGQEHKYGDRAAQLNVGVRSTSGDSTANNGSVVAFNGQTYLLDVRPNMGQTPQGKAASGFDSHEVIGGTHFDDAIEGGAGNDTIYGELGNDVLEGQTGDDFLYGGKGDDILRGGTGYDRLFGEGGDDILMVSFGSDAYGEGDNYLGGEGFNMISFADCGLALTMAADLTKQNIVTDEDAPVPYSHLWSDVSGLTGSKLADSLIGDADSNWLIGGSGDDTLNAGAGDDVIVGGSIQLSTLNTILDRSGQRKLQHFLNLLRTQPNFRLGDGGSNGKDTIVYTGKRQNFIISTIADPDNAAQVIGFKILDRTRAETGADGDIVIGADRFSFDGEIVQASSLQATSGAVSVAGYASARHDRKSDPWGLTATIEVPEVTSVTYQWQYSTDGGATWQPIAGATEATFKPQSQDGSQLNFAPEGATLRVMADYTTTSNINGRAVSTATEKMGRFIEGNRRSNRLNGTDFQDVISAGRGKDKIYAGAGNDYIDGGRGKDKMYGGAGDDTYVVDHRRDKVFENTNEGIDTVLSSISWSLGMNVENLTLTGSNTINATGNELNNVLTGNTGANVFKAGVGNDTLYLGQDSSVDTVVYKAGDGSDTVNQFVQGAIGDRLQFEGMTAIDVVVSGGSTFFRLSDNIEGNRSFGQGETLLTLVGTTGFTQANLGLNATGAKFLFA